MQQVFMPAVYVSARSCVVTTSVVGEGEGGAYRWGNQSIITITITLRSSAPIQQQHYYRNKKMENYA